MCFVGSIRHWVYRNVYGQDATLCSSRNRTKDSLYSYLLLFGACVSCMCNVGMLQTFGVHYATLVEEFGGKSAITGTAWAGSMCFGTSMFIGPFVSAIISKVGNRATCIIGSILGAIGFFASSFTHHVSEFFVTYGLIAGIGSGLAYLPTVVAVHDYFEKRLSMATGLLVSSSSCGMLLIAYVAQALNNNVGWRATMRIESLLFVASAISATSFVPRNERTLYDDIDEPSSSTTPIRKIRCDWSLWRVPSFCLYVAGTSIVMFGYMIPLVYLLDQANAAGIVDNASILPLYGGMALVGKLVFGFLADHKKANHFFLLIFALTTHGISMATIPTATTYVGLALIVTLLGISEGCYIMLRPLLVNRLFGPERLHQAWGFVLSVNSIPYVLDHRQPVLYISLQVYRTETYKNRDCDFLGFYTTAFYVGGACELIGCFTLSLIPILKKRTSTGASNAQAVSGGRCEENTKLSGSLQNGMVQIDAKSKKNVVDVGSMQGFITIPAEVEDASSQVSQEDIPIIFMRSDVPSVSQIVSSKGDKQSEKASSSKKTKFRFKPTHKFKFSHKEFPSAVALDRATTLAKEISNNVVQRAQNVLSNDNDDPIIDDRPTDVKPKNSFAVIPYFRHYSYPESVVYAKRQNVQENCANTSKSYDAVAAKEFDFHLEAGAAEQSHIAGLHNYFHDIMLEEPSEPSSTNRQHVRRQSLLRNIFKRTLRENSNNQRTSVSFSSVENMLSVASSERNEAKSTQVF